MPFTQDERYKKVKEIVCDILELDEDEVTDDGLFIEDYGTDSLRAIEILSSLEKELGVVIDQSNLADMVNLRSVNKVVSEAAGWS